MTLFLPHFKRVFRGGNLPTEAYVVLSIGLWFLGTKSTYREIAEQFGLSESCTYYAVKAVVDFLNAIAEDFVKWPVEEAAVQAENDFRKISGFPGIIGAIDGCHIECKVPESVQADYLNRASKHTINLMAVCKADRAFTFVHAGFVGSAHDSRVLKHTSFYDQLVAHPSPLFPSSKYHIVGDSAFPLSRHLLVPLKRLCFNKSTTKI